MGSIPRFLIAGALVVGTWTAAQAAPAGRWAYAPAYSNVFYTLADAKRADGDGDVGRHFSTSKPEFVRVLRVMRGGMYYYQIKTSEGVGFVSGEVIRPCNGDMYSLAHSDSHLKSKCYTVGL